MKRILSFAALAVVLFASCSKSSNNATPASNPLWPMHLNDQWSYVNTDYRGDGSVANTSIITYNIVSQQSIAGYNYFSLTDGTTYKYYRNSDDSTIWNTDLTGSNTVIFFKQVTATQTVIDTPQIFSNNNDSSINGRFLCTAYPDNVVVDGYNCTKVQQDLSYNGTVYFETNIYISRKIGIIRKEYYKQNASGNLYKYNQIDLHTYKIN